MKLNLGCGVDKREGYVNCDISPLVKPDKIIDLEKKLPFKKNSVTEVLAFHVLEHINNFIPLMHELYKVCKKNTIIKIKTPFYSAWGQFNDPTHVRSFTPFTFDYFKKGTYSHQVWTKEDMFKVENIELNFGIGKSRILNWFINPFLNVSHKIYCRFFAWIFPCAEIEFELKVLK